MAQNGLGEIQAAEARFELAKKAKARTSKHVDAANAALKAAVKAMEAALNAAKHDDQEAAVDLNKAEAALKAVNSKWEVIEVDTDDEDNHENRKRAAASVVEIDENEQKKRARYDNAATIFDAKSINVSGCSFDHMNGLYLRTETINGYPYFEHEHNDEYQLYHWHNGDWVIEDIEDCLNFPYICISQDCKDVDPLTDAWETALGFEAPLKLSIHELI